MVHVIVACLQLEYKDLLRSLKVVRNLSFVSWMLLQPPDMLFFHDDDLGFFEDS
ncbi:hypothetical protein DPMN_117860 [Dreissena polymorpha]|uniref:Uncharacterized protein n=1 Tax=Dreissena polymorpha TaxID=45954 RepID=A0A9D4GJS3_DREPO|nr:hypothetical protein DPMN_117860 [Dreissena polymorpha]